MIPIFIASIAFGGTGFKYASYASSICDLNKSSNTYICGCSYIRSNAPCEGQEIYYYDKYTYGICPPTNCNLICNQGGSTIINNKTMYVTKFTTPIDNYKPKCLIKKDDIPTAYIGGYSKKNIAIMASLLDISLVNFYLSICIYCAGNDEDDDDINSENKTKQSNDSRL